MENSFKSKALYYQLVDLLQERIEKQMIPHDKLPSERELTAQYGVSRTTVRLALQELESGGYIYRRHGKGTFVSDIQKKAADIAGAYSFTEQMKSLGRHPDTRILSFEQIEADKFIAKHLNLSLGEAIYKLSRLRSADREPLMIEDTYLPVKLFMTLDDKLLRSKPLYDLFSEDFNQTVRLADEELYASIASKEDAKQLMINEGAPVLHLARQTYNMKNEIIEFTLSVARADQFHYQIRHIRNS
ncbi:GntR family transcriptional regulator [Enterococcus devriesei]|uniref:GntR family transcriptional regulator n=1 Tax=Enterococcus devriesei TaxID=319970 RepID=A0A1L8SV24_9ENTE|nr:GntR family transcriptional regulator [Enterococcus devriesei]MDU6522696.1 GntR family transcriptional regulator [Enterococcus sp.]OJG35818.1 GntR family transcriptional regulator [Enterococcus devriesei]